MMSMMRWVCLLLAAAVAPTAFADGSAEAGAAKAATCVACHGPNGNSVNEQWPNIAGQNAAYIEAQLHAFHDKHRVDPTNLMPPMAAMLSDQDIEDVAAYFSTQTPTGHEADPSYWKAGEKLYRGGDVSRKIPACMACHGPVARGMPGSGYPALRAQYAVYLIKQLQDYAADQRYTHDAKGDSDGGADAQIMHQIASRLSAEDMRNLASYLQGVR